MPTPENPRSPLDVAEITTELAAAGLVLPPPIVLSTTQSTNADAARLIADAAPDWTIVVADHQSAGRGRLDRSWESKPGAALLASVIARPPSHFAPESLGWIPLMAGVVVAESLRTFGIMTGLKWPNDVVIDGPSFDGSAGPRKIAGILVERHGDGVVIGIGINIFGAAGELPVPNATSIAAEGRNEVDRTALLVTVMGALNSEWEHWADRDGDANASGLAQKYRALCLTISRQVRVQMADGHDLVGQATDVDSHGRLLLATQDDRLRAIAAGDVFHLR